MESNTQTFTNTGMSSVLRYYQYEFIQLALVPKEEHETHIHQCFQEEQKASAIDAQPL